MHATAAHHGGARRRVEGAAMGCGYRTHLLVEEREVRVVATYPRAHDVVENLDARLEHPEPEIEVLLFRSLTHEQRRPRVWRFAGGACGARSDGL